MILYTQLEVDCLGSFDFILDYFGGKNYYLGQQGVQNSRIALII